MKGQEVNFTTAFIKIRYIKTKTSIRINKQCYAQRSTKTLYKSFTIESVDSDSDRVVAKLKWFQVLYCIYILYLLDWNKNIQ